MMTKKNFRTLTLTLCGFLSFTKDLIFHTQLEGAKYDRDDYFLVCKESLYNTLHSRIFNAAS